MADASDASEGLAELERRCHELGIPVTVQRRAVLQALVGRGDHPTADDVYQSVSASMPGVSRGTVYRALDTLVALGLVVRVCHPGAAARFDPKLTRHHHLVCDDCGAIEDLETRHLDSLRIPDLGAQGFRVRDYSVHIRGLCKRCAARHGSQKKKSRSRG